MRTLWTPRITTMDVVGYSRPRQRNHKYTIGVFGAPKVGVTSILDKYIFGSICDYAIEGFGFANPHQTTIDVERVSPYTERTANMIVSKVVQDRLPQELLDLIVEKVIDLQREQKQTCKIELRQLKPKPEYPALHHYQLRLCDGVMLVYDVTSRESFEYIQALYDDVKKVFRVALDLRPFPFPLAVVANKVDLAPQCRAVSCFEGRAFADTIGCRPYFETSMHDLASMSRALHGITHAIYLYEELPLQFWRTPVESEETRAVKFSPLSVREKEQRTSSAAGRQRSQRSPSRNWLGCKVLQRIMEGGRQEHDRYEDDD